MKETTSEKRPVSFVINLGQLYSYTWQHTHGYAHQQRHLAAATQRVAAKQCDNNNEQADEYHFGSPAKPCVKRTIRCWLRRSRVCDPLCVFDAYRPPSLFRVKMLIIISASCCIKHTVLQVSLEIPKIYHPKCLLCNKLLLHLHSRRYIGLMCIK